MAKRIIIGTDHGGYFLKEKLKESLRKKNFNVIDVGTYSVESCDYPRIAYKAAKNISKGRIKMGILICKTGVGMDIVANKMPGVRAGVCDSVKQAVSSRQHNHANVLVLAAKRLTTKKASEILFTWLKTKPLNGRHARRVNQIKEIEKKVFRRRLK